MGGNPLSYVDPTGEIFFVALLGLSSGTVAADALAILGIGWALSQASRPKSADTCDACGNLAGPSSTPPVDPCDFDPGGPGCPARPSFRGAGPRGTIVLSPGARSNAAFQNYSPGRPVEFLYDPASNTFIVGRGQSHAELARLINADRARCVGGMFSRSSRGEILTNEKSGHFYQNWTSAVREQFIREVGRMSGQPITHWPGM